MEYGLPGRGDGRRDEMSGMVGGVERGNGASTGSGRSGVDNGRSNQGHGNASDGRAGS